jgi:hypothetical protein
MTTCPMGVMQAGVAPLEAGDRVCRDVLDRPHSTDAREPQVARVCALPGLRRGFLPDLAAPALVLAGVLSPRKTSRRGTPRRNTGASR